MADTNIDRITRNLLDTFVAEQALDPKDVPGNFERFSNFCVVSHEYIDEFNIEDVTVGGKDDAGLDGIAVIINGTLVTEPDDIEELARLNKYLEVDFIFIQAKKTTNFDAGDMGKFFFAVKDFFSEEPALARNELVQNYTKIRDRIFDHSAYLTRRNPNCQIYYVTAGNWRNPSDLNKRIDTFVRDLKSLNLFNEVNFSPIDASRVQQLFKSTRSRAQASIEFQNQVTLPEISGVQEAYLGVLPGTEYLKLITDDNENIKKSLFYDNVRDFQGENDVNRDIDQTIKQGDADQFCIRNNGITIVARSLNKVGNRFTIEDYQIVNGCQTSHVLFNNRNTVDDSLFVPIKLIVTEDQTITNSIIRSSNRQTEVRLEELQALSSFQKKLEDFYNTFQGDKALHYERRAKQYSDSVNIEKVRIISISYQIRYFASMFLEEPHRAGRYYGTLLDLIGEKVFNDDHYPDPYYTSSFAAYKLEWFFRNNFLDTSYRVFRYHCLMCSRILMQPGGPPNFNSRSIQKYCDDINKKLWDGNTALWYFGKTFEIVDEAVEQSGHKFNRDTAKTQSFTEDVRQKAIESAKKIGKAGASDKTR